MRANAKQLNEITNLVETGQIQTHIDKVFPLRDAVIYVNKRRSKGEVVIKIK